MQQGDHWLEENGEKVFRTSRAIIHTRIVTLVWLWPFSKLTNSRRWARSNRSFMFGYK